MGASPIVVSRLRAALVLGRVSNLPTLFSNALAGTALAGAGLGEAGRAAAALALLYVGGMYLNDAFDADIDARERPRRPIPAGAISRRIVFAAGFALLCAGAAAGATSLYATLAAAALAGCIVLYNAAHKGVALAPLVMGACRVLAYLLAAAIGGGASGATLVFGMAGAFCHIVGLTFAARQEAHDRLEHVWPLALLAAAPVAALFLSGGAPPAQLGAVLLAGADGAALRLLQRRRPGDVPRAVGLLIAAISLYDAALLAGAGAPPTVVALAALCCPATLTLQKIVPGT